MGQRQLTWLLCFQAFFVLVQLHDIYGDGGAFIRSLTRKLLRSTEDVYKPPNPSVYLALRLSKEHNLDQETKYLQRLRAAFQPTPSSPEHPALEQPSTGLLALYILALRASCEDIENTENKKLITQLKRHLHNEKEHIVEKGFPISNYYQYSLGVLSLCITHKKVDHHVIEKLLHAEEHDRFSHSHETSVDTEAVAGLTFLCLERSNMYSDALMEKLHKATTAVKEKIRTPGGVLGNIYSLPLAVQFLFALGDGDSEMECTRLINILVDGVNKEHFKNPMPISQLLPVLHFKNYLDIAKMNCEGEQELVPASRESKVKAPKEDVICIQLSVEADASPSMTLVHVQAGSSLLDVLKTAKKDKTKDFTFETKVTLSGQLLTAVKGIQASGAERTYWQVIKAPDTSLLEAIDDYIPEDEEHIILRLAHW